MSTSQAPGFAGSRGGEALGKFRHSVNLILNVHEDSAWSTTLF